MQIVIEIPEVFYESLREADMILSGRRSGKTFISVIYSAVANGKPLPKGHGDLIDRKELLKEKRHFEDFDGDVFDIIHEETVINATTIIPADKEK